MKRILFFLLVFFTIHHTYAQKEWRVSSPDKSLQLVLSNANGKLFYKVLSGSVEVVKNSSLGMETTSGSFSNGLSFVKSGGRRINELYKLTSGKRKLNHASGNETSVTFKNKNNATIQIDLRAYNDGVAFRYNFPENAKVLTVNSELTQFALPVEGKVWLQNHDLPSEWGPGYEGNYTNGTAIGTKAKDASGWLFPALFKTREHWLLLTEANLEPTYFAAHLDSNCANGVYKIAHPQRGEGNNVGVTTATSNTPFFTPWRMFIIGKKLGTIVESNLVFHLSAANRTGDVSWVKPGRSSWSWWGDHDSSRDFGKLKNFVDLAKEMGWEYSLVDANWNVMQGGGTIEDLVKYANSKSVPLWFWYNSGGPHNKVAEQPRDIMSDPEKRKAEFKKLRAWGIKGIKVDFFQSDKQDVIQLYHGILKDAAAEHILVNFHGCTLPRGWARTYPNLLSMEAVRGAENYGWGKEFAQLAPVQNNIFTYTRNVVGSMDYTPVTFSDYDCCKHTTTNAHELALSVLFETGILHFADRAASYQALDSKVKDFMRTVPTTWDETKFVRGEPGKETVLARRSGKTWYIAGSNGEARAKVLGLGLPFLSASSYKATVLADGASEREIKTSETIFKKGGTYKVNMLPHGGFLMVLSPQVK
ncbi:MAG TPA: glycoside hydrolase family 97 catalytic domain-containing protein [Pedobacter sp.]|jgi:hypothetical protein